MTRIVGVHGIGNYLAGLNSDEAAKQVARNWGDHLRRGLGPPAELDVAVAYYSHWLVGDQAQGSGDPEYLDAGEKELLQRWADLLGAPKDVAQGRLSAPARLITDWVAQKYGFDSRLVRIFMTRFCREVHTYFTQHRRRVMVRDEVADAITAHHPDIIIAHSLGSVIAYEVLSKRQDFKVELLLTLGSPLGMPDVIFDRLDHAPHIGRGCRPQSVHRWINVADPGDIVAIPKDGLSQLFHGVTADLTATIHTFSMHRVDRYLACSTTAASVAGVASW